MVSRLVPRKGIDDVIAALSHLSDTELVVAGGPPVAALDLDPEACRLARLARSFRVADRVRFLGAVPRQDVPALLRSADRPRPSGPPAGRGGGVGRRARRPGRRLQVRLEEVVLDLARWLHAQTGERAISLAGGVALNCVANGRLAAEGPVDLLALGPFVLRRARG